MGYSEHPGFSHVEGSREREAPKTVDAVLDDFWGMGKITRNSRLTPAEIQQSTEELRDALSEGTEDDERSNADVLRDYIDKKMLPRVGEDRLMFGYARVFAESTIAMDPSELGEIERLAVGIAFPPSRAGAFNERDRMDAVVELYKGVKAMEPMVSETYGSGERSQGEQADWDRLERLVHAYRIERMRRRVQNRFSATVERPFLMPDDRKEFLDAFADVSLSDRLLLLTKDSSFASSPSAVFRGTNQFGAEISFFADVARLGLDKDAKPDAHAREVLADRIVDYLLYCMRVAAIHDTTDMMLPEFGELFPGTLFGDIRSDEPLRRRLGEHVVDVIRREEFANFGERGLERYQIAARAFAGMFGVDPVRLDVFPSFVPAPPSADAAASPDVGSYRPSVVIPERTAHREPRPAPTQISEPTQVHLVPDHALPRPPEKPVDPKLRREILARLSDRSTIGPLVDAVEREHARYADALADETVVAAAAALMAELVNAGTFADLERRARVLLGDGWKTNDALQRAIDERTKLEQKVGSKKKQRPAAMRGIVHPVSFLNDVRTAFGLPEISA